MKKYVILLVIVTLLSTNGAAAEGESDEMIDMAQVVTDQLAPIDQWSVTIKETKDKSELLTSVSKARENGHNVTVTETKKAQTFQWKQVNQNRRVVTDFKIIVPNKSGYDAELIAVMSGTSWNTDVQKAYLNVKKQVSEQYFSHNSTKFACLTTREHDILPSGYVKQLFKETLDMTYIKKQNDFANNRHKKIVYGYTDVWPNEIRTIDRPMNFQMVFHESPNDGGRLTLGTPILINEY